LALQLQNVIDPSLPMTPGRHFSRATVARNSLVTVMRTGRPCHRQEATESPCPGQGDCTPQSNAADENWNSIRLSIFPGDRQPYLNRTTRRRGIVPNRQRALVCLQNTFYQTQPQAGTALARGEEWLACVFQSFA